MADDLKQIYRKMMDDHFPETMKISFGDQELNYKKRTWKIRDEKTGEVVEKGLRYGENPGQEAAMYELVNGNLSLGGCEYINPGNGLVSAISEEDMLQSGKHPGKTNLTDLDNGLNILKFLMDSPAAVILKHNNPSGAALGKNISEAYFRANRADRIAAFGGCLILNRAMDKETAKLASENYLEVIAAPDFEEGVLDILKKRPNLRIIRVAKIARLADYRAMRFLDFKSLIDGGLIVQQSPLNKIQNAEDFLPAETVYQGKTYKVNRQPTQAEYADMIFGWAVEQGVTSNSVIFVKDGATIGIGTGEQDRVGVAEIAVYKAYQKYADALCFDKYKISYKELELAVEKKEPRRAEQKQEIDELTKTAKAGLIGSTMVSDAFFPFRDGVDVGLRQGAIAVVQPGGSLRDYEVIEAVNEAGAAMVFTGQRAFRH
ncbi:MAG: IMP cyclohydrolase [Patescibacteria group bacterium]|jgi:phosphoribosylaminoimidazolecarboxamide formyltransferase/IMP cyclohydrolase